MVAAHLGVPVVEGALLLEAVRLADRRVEVDREGSIAGTGSGRPGPGEEMPADGIELADVAPAEAAQERAEGGRRLHDEPEDAPRPARPERRRVVYTVTTREGRGDEGEHLVAGVRATGCPAEVEMFVDECPEAEVLGQGGRQQEPRVGHQAVVVKRGGDPVEAVG